MQYKYAKERLDYSDVSGGRVFYSVPGHPAFPVRLASEIFQRCVAHRETIYGISTPCVLYDPCCGAAYHLSVLAYLHREHIQEVIGSDIDEKAVAVAERNLGLLQIDGLDKRAHDISKMFEQYGKESHKDALRSAAILKKRLSTLTEKHSLETKVFEASAMDGKEILKQIKPKSVDIVFTDVPYGQHSHWRNTDANPLANPIGLMLEALAGVLSPSSIVAIASDKQQKAVHERFQRIEHFQAGKRRVVILKPSALLESHKGWF
jgi:23S rRNA (guanine2535-N1)-methyltransferase